MADFPVGVSLVSWTALGAANAPVVTDGGATVTCPDFWQEAIAEVIAESTLTIPLCDDGVPYSFAIRGSMAVGAGTAGFFLVVTDQTGTGDGYFDDNIGIWPVGCWTPTPPAPGGTPTCSGESTALVVFGGEFDNSWSWDNMDPGVATTGTDPVAFVMAWDHDSLTASIDWGIDHYEAVTPAWVSSGDGQYHVKLYNHTANSAWAAGGYTPIPSGPWDAQLTDFEVEIFATTCGNEQCGRVTNATWNPAGL